MCKGSNRKNRFNRLDGEINIEKSMYSTVDLPLNKLSSFDTQYWFQLFPILLHSLRNIHKVSFLL